MLYSFEIVLRTALDAKRYYDATEIASDHTTEFEDFINEELVTSEELRYLGPDQVWDNEADIEDYAFKCEGYMPRILFREKENKETGEIVCTWYHTDKTILDALEKYIKVGLSGVVTNRRG